MYFMAHSFYTYLAPPIGVGVFLTSLSVNPISLSYPFPFVLPLALVPLYRMVSARGEKVNGYRQLFGYQHYSKISSFVFSLIKKLRGLQQVEGA